MNEPEIIERLTATKPFTTFPKTLDDAISEIRGLRAALAECAADFATNPGTVMSAQVEINREFQRRMDIAGNALAHEQSKDAKP